jgi:hypothetical protein
MSLPRNPLPPIASYSFGRLVLEGRTYTADLIILPDRIVPDWWREEGHSLSVADLAEVLEAKPEALVVGTGANDRMDVPQATRDALAAAGIALIAEHTAEACQTYNRLRTHKRLAAALHLTC